MAWEIGTLVDCKIVSTSLREINGKTVVAVNVESGEGDNGTALIFVTEASIRMARAQLKVLGFDVDTGDLDDLDSVPDFLSGKPVKIEVDEYNSKVQLRVALAAKPKPAEVKALTKALRAVGSGGKTKPKPQQAGQLVKAEPVSAAPSAEDDIPF